MLSDLVTFLAAASSVTTYVGSGSSARIYPRVLPQAVTFPAISYDQVSAIRVEDLSGPAGKARTRITIKSWALTFKEAHQLAAAVRQLINGGAGWWQDTRIGSVRLDNEFDLFDPEAGVVGAYGVFQDFIIGHLEA